MRTWIFLRGLTRESRHWGDFPDVFRAAMRGDGVVALDLPGTGRHFESRSPSRVEEMVEHCREEARAQGRSAPYHLLAMSLGAMVAVDWAARHPGEVAAAVLINTSFAPFSALHRRLKPRNYLRLVRTGLFGGAAREREALILRLTSSARARDRDQLDRWTSYARERPVRRINALRQLLAAARYRAPERRPALPLLILASSADRLVDSRCSGSIASRWQTAIAMHPTAGHDLPLDDGPWVAAQVRRWIESLG